MKGGTCGTAGMCAGGMRGGECPCSASRPAFGGYLNKRKSQKRNKRKSQKRDKRKSQKRKKVNTK